MLASALSGWARFAIAFLFIVLGRLVLKLEGRGPFIPDIGHLTSDFSNVIEVL